MADAERVGEIPFDSDRKLMTVVMKTERGYVSITKGAPDVLLKRVSDKAAAEEAQKASEEMSDRALRVLAAGIKIFDEMPEITSGL